MSLPYFPMYVVDYEAKTSHLSLTEDGAYFRLLRTCWMTPGCSMPDDEEWIMRRARARTDEEKDAVRAVISEFFVVEKGRVHNPRLTQEFSAANEAHKKRVKAGKKARGPGKPLKTNNNTSSNAQAMLTKPEPEPEQDITTDAARDLNAISDMLFEAAGSAINRTTGSMEVLSDPLGWIEQGADLEADVLPTIRRMAAKARPQSIRSWGYFREAVCEARDRRKRGLPAERSAEPSVMDEFKSLRSVNG